MVNYTKPELEVTEFEIIDVLTFSTPLNGSGTVSSGDTSGWDNGWY